MVNLYLRVAYAIRMITPLAPLVADLDSLYSYDPNPTTPIAAVSGGKACGQASVMLHWDDDSPLRKALTGYVQGQRVRKAPDAAPAATCPQSAWDSGEISGFFADFVGILREDLMVILRGFAGIFSRILMGVFWDFAKLKGITGISWGFAGLRILWIHRDSGDYVIWAVLEKIKWWCFLRDYTPIDRGLILWTIGSLVHQEWQIECQKMYQMKYQISCQSFLMSDGLSEKCQIIC